MKTTYMLMRPGEAPTFHEVDLAEEPTYDELKKLIGPQFPGADLERVSVLYAGQKLDMFVDERGLDKGLPINPAASVIYWQASMNRISSRNAGDPSANDARPSPVVGPAVLFLRPIWV